MGYRNIALFLTGIFFLGIFGFWNFGYSHPWNTSWDGCHYCRTNCGKWGYTYGTRHCHNGGVPQFGPADPLYYSSSDDSEGDSDVPPLETGEQACTRKYPWTIYQTKWDLCICANGNDWTQESKCENTVCKYTDGTKGKIGDVATNGALCTNNGWSIPKTKQEACDRKYPWTTYS